MRLRWSCQESNLGPKALHSLMLVTAIERLGGYATRVRPKPLVAALSACAQPKGDLPMSGTSARGLSGPLPYRRRGRDGGRPGVGRPQSLRGRPPRLLGSASFRPMPKEAAPRAITQRLWFPALFLERSRACSSRESRTGLRRNHISPIFLFSHASANLCTEETGPSSRECGPPEAARQGRFRERDSSVPLS